MLLILFVSASCKSFEEYILCQRCLKLIFKVCFASLMPASFKAEPLVVFFIMHPILKPIGYFLFPVMFACPMTMLDPYPVDLCTYVEDRFDPDRWLLFRDSTHLYWGIVLILVTRSSIPSPGWLFYRVECSDCEDQHCPCLCIFFLGRAIWLWRSMLPMSVGQNDWLWTLVLPLPVCVFFYIEWFECRTTQAVEP